MLFPTTIVFALLATITPVYSVPITNSPDALAVRSEHDSLEARNIAFAPAVEVEKREDESYEDILARDSDLYEDLEAREEDIYQELMVRSPEPEIEDMERRGKIGFVVKAAEKIGGFIKKIASKAHKARKVANAVSNNNNQRSQNQNQKHRRSLERRGGAYIERIEARDFELEARSKIGNKIKSAFKKIGNGVRTIVFCVVTAYLIKHTSDQEWHQGCC